MTLMRRPTESGLSPFQDMFERWFRDPFFSAMSAWSNESAALDVREEGDRYIVEADMPGVRPEDTDVTLEGRTLVIRGRYGDGGESRERGNYIVRERRHGEITRVVILPGDVESDDVSCTFENGELTVTLPKATASRARRIDVRPSGSADASGSSRDAEAGGSQGSASHADARSGSTESTRQRQQGDGSQQDRDSDERDRGSSQQPQRAGDRLSQQQGKDMDQRGDRSGQQAQGSGQGAQDRTSDAGGPDQQDPHAALAEAIEERSSRG